ncbi:hypothetical protein ACP2WS_11310, partial [Brachymonas sp. M4Q-1]
ANGDNQITGVASGLGGGTLANASGSTLTNAANIGDLQNASNAVTTSGLNFTGNDATAGTVHRDLGSTLAITGSASTAGSYSGANLKTVTNPTSGAIELQLADNPEFTSVTATDGAGNTTVTSAAGTTTKDAAGNTSTLSATGVTLTPTSGNAVSLTTAGL